MLASFSQVNGTATALKVSHELRIVDAIVFRRNNSAKLVMILTGQLEHVSTADRRHLSYRDGKMLKLANKYNWPRVFLIM